MTSPESSETLGTDDGAEAAERAIEPVRIRKRSARLWLSGFLLASITCVTMLAIDRLGGFGPEGSFQLSDRLSEIETQRVGDQLVVIVEDRELSPEAFVTELHRRREGRRDTGGLYAIFNITSWTGLVWVGLGLFAQMLFTARMIVQWLASERVRASVVPESFWWLSLIGATMLLLYFTWRVDVVGIIGQSTGWGIYVRNLWLIHFGAESKHEGQTGATESTAR